VHHVISTPSRRRRPVFIDGVAEHEVAYDVMCRVKRLLRRHGAVVHPIIEDPAGSSSRGDTSCA
jgi:hypothetical protein